MKKKREKRKNQKKIEKSKKNKKMKNIKKSLKTKNQKKNKKRPQREYLLQTVHLTRHFLLCTMRVLDFVLHNTLAQVSARARHFVCMVIHVVRLSVCSLTLCSSPRSLPCVSPIPSSSTWTLTCTSSSMWASSGQYTTGTPPNEESGPLAEFTPLTPPVTAQFFFVKKMVQETVKQPRPKKSYFEHPSKEEEKETETLNPKGRHPTLKRLACNF